MNFKNFSSVNYLFNINRVLLPDSDKWFLVVGLVLFILGIIFKLAVLYAPNPVDKKYRQRFFHLFFYIGLAEMAWFGARLQDVNFFGTHFLAWLIILFGLVWLGFLLAKMLRSYHREKRDWNKEQVKLKYLPR